MGAITTTGAPVASSQRGPLKTAAKALAQGLALGLTFPFAVLAGFGRFRAGFDFGAHAVALLPGLPGDYLRVAYYAMTLAACPLEARISFGTVFSSPRAQVGRGVYIGGFCEFGDCEIGARTQIAAHVQILSGRRQHARAADGRILGSDAAAFTPVRVGNDCWLGAAAIIMADVGPQSTVGAGAVVTRPVPAGVVAVGNPARPLAARARGGSACAE